MDIRYCSGNKNQNEDDLLRQAWKEQDESTVDADLDTLKEGEVSGIAPVRKL